LRLIPIVDVEDLDLLFADVDEPSFLQEGPPSPASREHDASLRQLVARDLHDLHAAHVSMARLAVDVGGEGNEQDPFVDEPRRLTIVEVFRVPTPCSAEVDAIEHHRLRRVAHVNDGDIENSVRFLAIEAEYV